jgi:glutaredoxin 3
MSKSDRVAEITVYTLPWCSYCTRAKALLSRRGLPFREVDGTGVPDFRRRLAALTGRYTVPQIVIDGEPIGGADRLARLDRLGVLEAIATGDSFPIDRETRRITPRALAGWAAARLRGQHDVSAVNRVRVRIDAPVG